MKGMDDVRRICEKKIANGKPPSPPRCSNCDDHGLLYRCTVAKGVTYWGACRCACLQALDWGVVSKSEDGRLEYGVRPFGRDIPHQDDVRDISGRALNRDELYSLAERLRAEDQLASAHSADATAEREAIQSESDYGFPL